MKIQDDLSIIQKHLTDDLRNPPWRGHPNTLAGHCYVASEAAWHLLGGMDSDWRPQYMRHEGVSHWFLLNKSTGSIIDLTVWQFANFPDHSKAVGKGFLTKEPSKRAQRVIQGVMNEN